jgi:hypothetical protein
MAAGPGLPSKLCRLSPCRARNYVARNARYLLAIRMGSAHAKSACEVLMGGPRGRSPWRRPRLPHAGGTSSAVDVGDEEGAVGDD